MVSRSVKALCVIKIMRKPEIVEQLNARLRHELWLLKQGGLVFVRLLQLNCLMLGWAGTFSRKRDWDDHWNRLITRIHCLSVSDFLITSQTDGNTAISQDNDWRRNSSNRVCECVCVFGHISRKSLEGFPIESILNPQKCGKCLKCTTSVLSYRNQ